MVVELIYTGRTISDNSVVMLLPQRKLLFAVTSFSSKPSPTAR